MKTLSDDEVTELEVRPTTTMGGYRRVLLRPSERDALCQTVRALRASDEHNYQLWLGLKERHAHKFASADGRWSDTCQQCGVTAGDDHDGYDCIAWLQRQLNDLQSQLAQVTQERQLCLQVQKRGIHSSVTCPCVIAMERSNESPQH